MQRRAWIKIFCDGWLRGSIRKESLEVRAVFADLLAMAGDSAYGNHGSIRLATDVGFEDESIAGILNVPLDVWRTVKDRLSNVNSNDSRITILPQKIGYSIEIINWNLYQSEYQRQSKYRKITPIREDKRLRTKLRSIDAMRLRNIPPSSSPSIVKELILEQHINEVKKPYVQGTVQFNFDSRRWTGIVADDKADWAKAYPACDIDQELAKMAAWLLANPEKKKSRYRRFIVNWLTRAQDRGGSGAPRIYQKQASDTLTWARERLALERTKKTGEPE